MSSFFSAVRQNWIIRIPAVIMLFLVNTAMQFGRYCFDDCIDAFGLVYLYNGGVYYYDGCAFNDDGGVYCYYRANLFN